MVRRLISMKKEVEVVSWDDPGKGQLAWTLKNSATRVRDLTYDIKKITRVSGLVADGPSPSECLTTPRH